MVRCKKRVQRHSSETAGPPPDLPDLSDDDKALLEGAVRERLLETAGRFQELPTEARRMLISETQLSARKGAK